MNDNNITELFENYIKNVLKIPYCNFDGLDPKISYEIVVGLSLMYEMYPFFNRVICSITQEKDLESHINILNYSDKDLNQTLKILFNDIESKPSYFELKSPKDAIYGFYSYTKDKYYKSPLFFSKNYIPYFSILIFDENKKIDITKYNNISGITSGRFGIYHEFGHLLDIFLNISNSEKLKKIIEGHDIKNEISEYACTSNRELVACAFSRYILSKKKLTNLEKKLGKTEFCDSEYVLTSLVNEIGNLIDYEYNKFVKLRNLKLINNRYNFNKRFSIQKNYEIFDIQKLKIKIRELKI